MKNQTRIQYVAVSIIMAAVLLQGHRLSSAGQPFDSPLPTPIVVPTPMVAPVPPCHAQAMAFVAREHNIPLERLIAGSYVSNQDGQWTSDGREEWIELPFIQRKVCSVKVLVKDGDEVYPVALDEQGQVVDLDELQALESEVAHAECGKLDPTLCDRLPALAPDERVEVAVWLTDIDLGAIYDAVAADYAPSLQPQQGLPFDIGHPDYEKAFRQVQDLLPGAYREKEEPVMAFLETAGFKAAYASTSAQVVFAELPQDVISVLAAREDVIGIYLLGGQFEDAMDSIAPTIRVPTVWDEGYTGNGVRVAVVEDDPVDFGNQYLDHAIGETGPAQFAWYPDDMSHITQVAGVIAMKGHPLYQGVAPNVRVCSADAGDWNPQSNVAVASDWAIWECVAYVLNCSFGMSASTHDFWARYYDYVVFYDRRTVVAATQNQGGAVTSPATGYNVISVGAFDDHDNPSWADDTISAFSNYQGPENREKPEVVAVGENVCTTDWLQDTICNRTGTSFAAPQVSGLAALLMQKAGLYLPPEPIKAAIMASAVHNIEGDPRLSDRDGVGGIDAALAYDIVDHGRYGVAAEGWYDYKTVYYSSFDANGYLHYSVPASRGEKVRVVLTWDSHPNISDPYGGDQLHADLNLRVYRPNGSAKATSLSAWNNFEIVEFTADESGIYDVRVERWYWSASYEYIGIAWVKDATYLPDVRGNYDGWNSVLRVRNDGAQQRYVTVTFFDRNGTANPRSAWLNPNQLWAFNVGSLIGSNFAGSAIVDGGEDVAVVVMNIHQSYPYATGSYTGLTEAGQTLSLPLLQRANNSMYSDFTLFNAGTASAQVQVQYIPEKSPYTGCTATGISIPANGSRNFNSRDGTLGCTTSSPFVGGARVTSTNGQPLVAVANQWRDKDANGSIEGFMSYEAFPAGDTASYMPLLQYNNNGWYTSSTLQDTSAGVGTATICYYPEDGAAQCDCVTRWLTANDIEVVFPSPPAGNCTPQGKFVGAGYATRSNSFAVVVNQEEFATGNKKMSYSAVRSGAATVVVPWVMKNKDNWQGRNDWYSGINVQNVGSANTNVTVRFYDNNGNLSHTEPPRTVSPGATIVYFPVPMGDGFVGSAVVTTDNGQPIAVVANHLSLQDYPNDTVDTYMSHTGLNR